MSKQSRKKIIKKQIQKYMNAIAEVGFKMDSTEKIDMESVYLYTMYLERTKNESKEYEKDFREVLLEEYPKFEKYLSQKDKDIVLAN